jgi:hypothetical protein
MRYPHIAASCAHPGILPCQAARRSGMTRAMPGYSFAAPRSKEYPMPDPTSDLTFRPQSVRRVRRDDEAWEAVVREELVKLRRRSPSGPRVIPASRESAVDVPESTPPAA